MHGWGEAVVMLDSPCRWLVPGSLAVNVDDNLELGSQERGLEVWGLTLL